MPGTISIRSPAARRRFVQPGQRVVVGDRDPGQTALHGEVDRSVGVNVPSERFVCAWRSYPAMTADGGRRGRRPSRRGARARTSISATVRHPQSAIAFSNSCRRSASTSATPASPSTASPQIERTRDQDRVGPQGERLHDVGAAADPAVHQHRARGRPTASTTSGSAVRPAGDPVQLAATVVRDDDAVDARPPPPARRPRRSGSPSRAAGRPGGPLTHPADVVPREHRVERQPPTTTHRTSSTNP